MEFEKGRTYYIEAKAKGIVFFPSGRYYTHNEEIKGNLDGSTLLMVKDAIDIIEIKEIKATKPKVKEVIKEEAVEQPQPQAKDIEEEFEDMLKEE